MSSITSMVVKFAQEIDGLEQKQKKLYCERVKSGVAASMVVAAAATVCAVAAGSFLGICLGGFTLIALRDIYQITSNVESQNKKPVTGLLNQIKPLNDLIDFYTANTTFARPIFAALLQL